MRNLDKLVYSRLSNLDLPRNLIMFDLEFGLSNSSASRSLGGRFRDIKLLN